MKERDLNRLAELLDVVLPQVKDEEFNINVWKGKRVCGTVACAVGHACFHPPFQKAGLRLSYYDVAMFQGYRGIYAVIKFFNLTEKEVKGLFMPQSYPDLKSTSKKEVKERIKELLETNSL